MNSNATKTKCLIFVTLAYLLFLVPAAASYADTIDDLKTEIATREAAIKALEAEIAAAQLVIDQNRGQQKTLANAVKIYDAERKKLLSQIQVTKDKIEQKELEITSLGADIDSKSAMINNDVSGLSELIRARRALEEQPSIVAMLNNMSLSTYWDELRQSEVLSIAISGRMQALKTAKQGLEEDKANAESKRRDLGNLSKQLTAQKQAAESSLREKQQLLAATKNKESEYQKLLKQKLAAKEDFEKELLAYESQLNFAIDPNSIPTATKGVLSWPLDVIKITQYFGNTAFAAAHTQLYNGSGHNGVDFGAPTGTPVKAALAGIVKGSGNTDTACPGASYGKWILVEHNNGLSTLYAHLSVFSVSAGDKVNTGDILGLSGNTGYTTGPHLHFTVYATQGVKIMSRQSKVCSGIYTMPIADLKAYLNPLSYL